MAPTKRRSNSTRSRSMVLHEAIERRILMLRGCKVIIDSDLAALYGVPTKALNQAVKRNIARFPDDFLFRLSRKEKREVVTVCDHLGALKFSPTLPFAFTEHGAIMAANLLNSDSAVRVSIEVVRVFVRIRRVLAANESLARRIDELESRYDSQFQSVFDAIRSLLDPPEEPKSRPSAFITTTTLFHPRRGSQGDRKSDPTISRSFRSRKRASSAILAGLKPRDDTRTPARGGRCYTCDDGFATEITPHAAKWTHRPRGEAVGEVGDARRDRLGAWLLAR